MPNPLENGVTLHESTNETSDLFESILNDLDIDVDSLDAADFDEVAYINELFPSEQSLTSIESVIDAISRKINDIDTQTRQIIHGQCKLEEEGQLVVNEATEMIEMLFLKIHEVQERATSSENMVEEITHDIQKLDQAKKNLTLSITTLNNLASIVSDLDKLNEILGLNATESKRVQDSKNPFGNIPTLLSSPGTGDHLARAQRLMEPMLSVYSNVPAIKELEGELNRICQMISDSLSIEMKDILTTPSANSVMEQAPKVLAGCRLLDLLPTDRVKVEVLNLYISKQLAEYKELFEPSQSIAWLDKIDHRYAWLRSNLSPLERKIRILFPSEWLVLERLIVEFCRITHHDLEVTMQRRRSEITHNLLIFALQRTLAFENSLAKVASGATLLTTRTGNIPKVASDSACTNPFGSADSSPCPVTRKHIEPTAQDSKSDEVLASQQISPFKGIISSCFDPYFDLYLTHVDRALQDQLTSRLIGDMTVNKSSLSSQEFIDVFRDGDSNAPIPVGGGAADNLAENTLYSATDLFLLYKQLLKQTLQLSRGKGLLGLISILRKYLTLYTEKVLCPAIPGYTPPSGISSGSNPVPSRPFSFASLGLLREEELSGRDVAASALAAAGNLSNQFFSNLLRDDQPVRLSKDEVVRVCVILVTASYCIKTVEELEKRLKSEIQPPSLSASVSFTVEIDAFAECRSACVHRLVADLEASVIPQLSLMVKMPWNSLTAVGDQSAYITAIINHLRNQVPLVRDTLFSVRAHFTQICIKFADAIISRFVASLYRCKPVNTFGAEQLLLDTQCLKSALFQLPLFGTKISQSPPRSFTGLVQEGMAHAERIIKSVMLPIGTPLTLSNPVPSSNAPTSLNPFDPPKTEDSSLSSGSGGSFVLGPIDKKAADAFIKSFLQLVPDADVSVLQKVIDMKGVKRGEQFTILDSFRESMSNRNESTVSGELKHSASLGSSLNSGETGSISELHAPQGRMRPFESLVKKR